MKAVNGLNRIPNRYPETRTLREMSSPRRALTLLELLVVIALLAILEGMHLPALSWSNALVLNGSIVVVVSTVITTATNINANVSGSKLEVSWPDDHTGWQLQVQTNSVAEGFGGNWVPWVGSVGTNQVLVPIDPSNGAVCLRLVYLPQ